MVSLYNSLTQKKVSIDQSAIKLYVCGLTVYDKAHIGHLRTMLVFDLLIRYLLLQGKQVTYVRNITDVDDKIIQRMHEEGREWEELTTSVIADIKKQEEALDLMMPAMEPKASEYIQEMIDMITVLLDKDHAYIADNGDVYFSVASYPEYGSLSKQKLNALLKEGRVESDVKKGNGDFILWKQSKEGEPFWSSPWGNGRPGWHIECSAISTSCLGNTFDIHGGGVDLKFPHHENEIAQSICATKGQFAKLWMHVGHLLVDNEKMSKSLHNFITVETFLNQYHPELIRLFLLKTHYRQPYNYTESAVVEMQKVLLNFYLSIWNQPGGMVSKDHELWIQFQKALDDDLNVAKALSIMHEVSTKIVKEPELAGLLVEMGSVFGILQSNPTEFLQPVDQKEIESLISERNEARVNKDYALSDKIRDDLLERGIVLEDGKTTRWYYQDAGVITSK